MSAATITERRGVYRDLAEPDYHSDPHSVSYSGLKLIMDSPSLYRYRIDNPERKSVWDFGSAAHAEVLGKGYPIAVIDVDDKRGKKWSEPAEAAEAEGKIPITRREAAVIAAMAEQISANELAAKLLSAGDAEVSAFWHDERWGVTRRCRYDWLHGRVAVDYKTSKSANPEKFRWACRDYAYDGQGAQYLDVAAGVGLDVTRFVHIVQEKDPPYRVAVVEMDADSLARGSAWCATALERFRDCRDADLWPGFESPEPHLISVPPRREDHLT